MTSDDAKLRPVFALESGPAAGVVAALGMAERLGLENLIAFDMGGTTAKASLIENGADLPRARVRGRRLDLGRQPADPRRGRAAADPDDRHRRGRRRRRQHRLARSGRRAPGRPAERRRRSRAGLLRARRRRADGDRCQRRARLHAGGAGRRRPDHDSARARRGGRRSALPSRSGCRVLEAADGIHRIANARMTRALRSVSSEKGRDPRDFAIIAYGGSGPVHAGGLADDLGVTTVLVPPVAGLFSAVGLLFARPEFHEVRSCHLDVDAVDPAAIATLLEEMEARARPRVRGPRRAGVGAHRRPALRRPELGDRGRAAATARSTARCSTALRDRFEDEHEVLYGVRGQPGSPVEVRAVRLAALGASAAPPSFDVADALVPDRARDAARCGSAARRPTCRCGRARRSEPTPEAGPLLVDEYDTTVVVPDGLDASAGISRRATLVLEREAAVAEPRAAATDVRSGDAADRRERAAVDRRRDGDDDHPHRALDRRPRRDGLLVGALRRARRDGRPGGQRPLPPRLDPDRDGVAARPLRRSRPPRRRLHHERPLRRGHAPAGHLHRQAGAPRATR